MIRNLNERLEQKQPLVLLMKKYQFFFKYGNNIKNKVCKIIVLQLLLINPTLSFCQIFHDNQGNAILYYNSTANILYDYSGNCKFFYKSDNLGDINIYNFSGKHLGWYINGTLRDHQGRIMASETNKLINVTYRMPPVKHLQKITPLKALEELGPIRPMWVDEFSSYSILYYAGRSTLAAQQPNPYSTPNDYTAMQKRQPYELPGNKIAETVEALNNRHNELVANGYVYHEGKYYSQEEYKGIANERKRTIEAFNAEVNKLKNLPIAIKKEEHWINCKIADEKEKELVEVTLEINKDGECNKVYHNNFTGNFRKGIIISRRAERIYVKTLIVFGNALKGIPVSKDFPIWIFIEPGAREFKSKKDVRAFYKLNQLD